MWLIIIFWILFHFSLSSTIREEKKEKNNKCHNVFGCVEIEKKYLYAICFKLLYHDFETAIVYTSFKLTKKKNWQNRSADCLFAWLVGFIFVVYTWMACGVICVLSVKICDCYSAHSRALDYNELTKSISNRYARTMFEIIVSFSIVMAKKTNNQQPAFQAIPNCYNDHIWTKCALIFH